jgi:hypothetical protein
LAPPTFAPVATTLPSGATTTITAPTPPIRVNAGGGPVIVHPQDSTDSDVLVEVGAGVAGAAGLVGLGLAVTGVRRRRAVADVR